MSIDSFPMQGYLALEDGYLLKGKSFGIPGIREGEIVFNTSMTGYQEVLTDPSYAGQIVVFTYPLMGNTGMNPEDNESIKAHVRGMIVRELSSISSNWRATETLENYFCRNNMLGLSDVDTRSLTLHIRDKGAMRAVIAGGDWDAKELVKRAQDSPGLIGVDHVQQVSRKTPYTFLTSSLSSFRVVVYDFGVKQGILQSLSERYREVIVVPATTTASSVLEMKPDCVLLSNGPGDPEPITYAIDEIRKLAGKVPLYGICLGHQLLALAFGGKTYKMKFGHRGSNQPVKNLLTGKIEITSQNHGFCVAPDSLSPEDWEITHWNLNDNTVEGMRHRKFPIASVQYHPEASPGPHDSHEWFHTLGQISR